MRSNLVLVRTSGPKVLAVSLGICLFLALVGGALFAALADRVLAYGLGTGLFLVGIIVLGMGLLGAAEPPEGWATRKGTQGRRSVAARAAKEHPDFEGASSLALAVWSIAVGGSLIALSLLAFSLAAR
ncbi:hypothetical protein BH24ACT26_BH24ACT26_21600 [soil metagenome]